VTEHEGFIPALLDSLSDRGPEATTLRLYDGEQLTDISSSQFTKDILTAAGYFKSLGVAGRHIALVAPNSYRWLVTFYGIAASGNVAVPLNPELPAELLQEHCALTDVSLVFTEGTLSASLPQDMFLDYGQLMQAAPIAREDVYSAQPDDTAVLMMTSGTTGKSKAVELTHRNMYHCMTSPDGVFFTPDVEVVQIVLPMFHIGGLRGATSMLYMGKTVCLGRGVRYLFEEMAVFNPTYLSLVPSVVESIAKICRFTKDKEARQKYFGRSFRRTCAGGAGIKPEICRFLVDQGFILDTSYAMTESSGVGTWGVWDEAHPGTIGKFNDRVQCQIRDGELLFKGPAVMKGYYKDPEATAQILEDGWLHTGDMGYRDEEGNYYITGRKKNVIILSNGENVNPEEVEAALSRCPAIAECMVYSDGKGICADVYAKNPDGAAAFIRAYNEEMPKYRQVYKVLYSAEPLEKTGSGKIKRKENK
jgi:long-chain acyl-CoA synthetase